jgi:hypothetical protein
MIKLCTIPALEHSYSSTKCRAAQVEPKSAPSMQIIPSAPDAANQCHARYGSMILYLEFCGRSEYACETMRRYLHANWQHPVGVDGITSDNVRSATPLPWTHICRIPAAVPIRSYGSIVMWVEHSYHIHRAATAAAAPAAAAAESRRSSVPWAGKRRTFQPSSNVRNEARVPCSIVTVERVVRSWSV